ncbi:MAG: hypothetical protein CBB96_08965 [Gammaproteobacteria bacterium TMED36]|nr:MAG: hypothetical protein CBB96_08965 [Gammaproteobacteria bacterium TMED36]|tara:strand:- start:343 stop:669 length:327 start_codon:yes stop_codon:yes gene_type:complete
MAKETIIKETPDPPKPVKASMTVNEKIQVTRFYARFGIALGALAIFSYIVHMMLIAPEELAASSKDLLNILIGAFIPILAGISKFYFESGGDLHDHSETDPTPEPSKE